MVGTNDTENPFADNLRTLIFSKWPSQKAFSNACGIDDGGLSRILSRQSNAEPDTLAKIARVLELDEFDFVAEAYQIQRRGREGRKDEALERYNRIRERLTHTEEDVVLTLMESYADKMVEQRSSRAKKKPRA